MLLASDVARGAPLPQGSTPLTGSSFQGGDGNQADQAGPPAYVDWQRFQATGRVVHNPDPNAFDDAFGGGSEELEPGGWTLTTENGGVAPGKANIVDGWSAVDQPDGHTFLYLAFAREAANGDTILAFELNQDARTWVNDAHARIPCRTTGDLLVVVVAHGNGIDLALERWTTTATDPETGCATRGTLREESTVPNGSAQGNVNAGPITNYLRGFYGTSIPEAHLFAETAIDLSRLLDVQFDDPCFSFGSIWMHSRASDSVTAQMKDYVRPQPLIARNCAASGTKFLDLDADGTRDEGEPGLERWFIWADYDGDGVRDANEPFTITDDRGDYVLNNIQPPGGTYRLREARLVGRRRAVLTGWQCSFPNASTEGGFGNGAGGLFPCGWGPISPASTPYAQDKDFGNWVPAQLTIEKELLPSDDPGRFTITVNGTPELIAVGDEATTTIPLEPGSYDIAETAVPPADAADYDTTVSCRTTPLRRGRVRAGTTTTVVLHAGDQATCRFTNRRKDVPVRAIAIEKTGPAIATAGDRLSYALSVTNPGTVPIAAADVNVSDERCDEPPELDEKFDEDGDDDTPDTLDPGDRWTYRCSHDTPEPGADCVVSAVTNTAVAEIGDTGIRDDSTITTTLYCPDVPPDPPVPPIPPTPTPTPPTPVPPAPNPVPGSSLGPVLPAGGPTVPTAGRAARAGLRARAGCISHVSQIRLVGTHIRRIRVTVDGRIVRAQTLRLLQRTARPLNRFIGPGRHRVSVRVTFERGSGTPPVTLARTIAICGALAPRFTG